jgi:hypothetical protein
MFFQGCGRILGIIVDLARQGFTLPAMLVVLVSHAAIVNRADCLVYIGSPINLALNCPAPLAGLIKILAFSTFHSTWT